MRHLRISPWEVCLLFYRSVRNRLLFYFLSFSEEKKVEETCFFFTPLKILWKLTSLVLVGGVTPQSEALGLSSGTCLTVAAVIISKWYIFTGFHMHVVRDWTLLHKWMRMRLLHVLLQMLLGYAPSNRWINQLLTAQALGGPTTKNLCPYSEA